MMGGDFDYGFWTQETGGYREHFVRQFELDDDWENVMKRNPMLKKKKEVEFWAATDGPGASTSNALLCCCICVSQICTSMNMCSMESFNFKKEEEGPDSDDRSTLLYPYHLSLCPQP